MFSYQAYGLGINSQLRLFDLPCEAANDDVTITLGSISSDAQQANLPAYFLKLLPEEAILNIPSVGKFDIRQGKEIILDPEPGADEILVQGYLVGAAMAILLNQRGRLVLHASAVSIDGFGIAFMGASGSGKSSTAASLLQRGHPLLTDDIIAIEFSSNGPIFYPGFPHLKLAPEAAQSINANSVQLKYMDEFDDKLNYLLLQTSPGQAVRIQCIYILNAGDPIEIQKIPAQQAVIEMVRYSMPYSLVKLNRAEHFNRCVQLAGFIHCYQLTIPRTLEILPKAAERVEEHVKLMNV